MYVLEDANYYNKSTHFIRTHKCAVFISHRMRFWSTRSLRNRTVFMF